MGVTDWGAHINIHVGPGVQSKKEPLLGHGKNLSSAKYGRGQREWPITEGGTPGHSMEQTGRVLKQKRTTKRIEISKGKAVIIAFSALYLT